MPTPDRSAAPIPRAPILVTAVMGAADQARFDALRRGDEASPRPKTPAHITLFRHLPPSAEAEIKAQLAHHARAAPPEAWIDGAIALDRGVAIAVRSPALLAIRDALAGHFAGLLAQDQAAPRFHITIANTLPQTAAKALLDALRRDITPRPLAITGLACWFYRDGPWDLIGRYPFRGG